VGALEGDLMVVVICKEVVVWDVNVISLGLGFGIVANGFEACISCLVRIELELPASD
jgi:hypothetical protein